MLTLDTALCTSASVSFPVVGENAFLLNAQTIKYFALEKAGPRLWELLNEGKPLKIAHQIMTSEYEVDSA